MEGEVAHGGGECCFGVHGFVCMVVVSYPMFISCDSKLVWIVMGELI